MASNVFTKNEILQNLAQKGFFIDAYTLDTFFEKWKVEAIFEDEQGSEFFDKNALDLVLSKLFNTTDEENEDEKVEEPRLLQAPTEAPSPIPTYFQPTQAPSEIPTTMPTQAPTSAPIQQEVQQPYIHQNTYEMQPQPMIQHTNIGINQDITDIETNKLLSGISLSDGSSLLNKIQNTPNDYLDIDYKALEQEAIADIESPRRSPFEEVEPPKEKKMGILEGAMLATNQEFNPDEKPQDEASTSEGEDFDDISLLSESYEAQEKFREYVVSELSKKNMDLTPKNEFKLDISERTLNMIARSMAKKIVKHVSQIYSNETKSVERLEEIERENEKLESRAQQLEDQNKKLRLLLAESNRNLNSYKPSIFGLYKKVPPQQ